MKFRTIVFVIALLAVLGAARKQVVAASIKAAKHHQYQLIDLGTLGGAISTSCCEGNGGPLINSRGAALAFAETTVPVPANSNSFPCNFPDPNVNHALVWQDGSTTDLSALPPSDNCSIAQGINDKGSLWASRKTV